MMRKLLMTTSIVCLASGSALAADLPNFKGPPVYAPLPPPAFTWSGPYIGAQVGYEWGSTSPSLYAPDGSYITSLAGTNSSGVIGGAHIGYNWQVSQFVFGLEGDVNGTSYNGSNSFAGELAPYTTRETVEGSIRGRVGVAWDRVLFYGTGGVALGNFQDTYTGAPGYDSLSTTRVGWTVGGGVEYAVTDNWSIRAEYRYTDFGHVNDYLVNSLPGYSVNTHQTDNRVQAGFSYKFDMFAPPGPVAARY
jgi:outer membrane immunogenic protein